MILIGLTGSLGTGKTTVCEMLVRHGAIAIDADRIVGDLQTPQSLTLARMTRIFGEEILNRDGSLNRGRMAQIAFSNPRNLAKLNNLLHPAVRRRERALITLFNDYPLVALNVPLLIENRLHRFVDFVVVVNAERQIVEQRLMDNRGMTREQINERMRAQMPLESKVSMAHFIIDNSGSREETAGQVGKLTSQLKKSNIKSLQHRIETKSIP